MEKDTQRKHKRHKPHCLLGKHCMLEKKVRGLEATIIEQQDKRANVVLLLGDTVAELRLIQAESAEQKETIAALQNTIAIQQAVITAKDAVMEQKVAVSQLSATCDRITKECERHCETNAMLLSMVNAAKA